MLQRWQTGAFLQSVLCICVLVVIYIQTFIWYLLFGFYVLSIVFAHLRFRLATVNEREKERDTEIERTTNIHVAGGGVNQMV